MTHNNLLNVLRQISVYGVLAVGMSFVIISGGIDLSVGSIAGLAGAVASTLMVGAGLPLGQAMATGLLIGTVLGIAERRRDSLHGHPAFIMTLATMTTIRGIAYLVCNGKPIGGLPDELLYIGIGTFLGIPVPILFMTAMFLLEPLAPQDRHRPLHLRGRGETSRPPTSPASRPVQPGQRLRHIRLHEQPGRDHPGRPEHLGPAHGRKLLRGGGDRGLRDGGVSMNGGSGSIVGVFLGAFLMGIINNGMNLMGINSYWQLVVKGLIIMLAVIYSIYNASRKSRS
jgi:ribose/xylose/arabinose/galactoside ABC-type transport system permease subunit